MNNIKDLKTKLSSSFQLIILAVLCAIFVVNIAVYVDASSIGTLLAGLGVTFSIIWLFIKNSKFTSYLLITVLMFGGALNTLLIAIFGYNFSASAHPFGNNTAWDWIYIVLSLVALLYLFFMTTSYATTVKKNFRIPRISEWLSIIIVGCYFFLFGSLGNAILLLVFAVVSLLFGDYLASLAVVFSLVIERPFIFFAELGDGSYRFSNSIYYWIDNITAILLVAFVVTQIVLAIIKLPNKNIEKTETIEGNTEQE